MSILSILIFIVLVPPLLLLIWWAVYDGVKRKRFGWVFAVAISISLTIWMVYIFTPDVAPQDTELNQAIGRQAKTDLEPKDVKNAAQSALKTLPSSQQETSEKPGSVLAISDCDLLTASEFILNDRFLAARNILKSCERTLDDNPLDDRDKEIEYIRKIGLAIALLDILNDEEGGFASKDDLDDSARIIRAIVIGNIDLAWKSIEGSFSRIWVKVQKNVEGIKVSKYPKDIRSIQEAFCGYYSCCGGYETLGVTGPHPSIIHIASYLETSIRLTGNSRKMDTCLPNLNDDYLKIYGINEKEANRFLIVGFGFIDDALGHLHQAPSESDKITDFEYDSRRVLDNSARWYQYKAATDALHNAMSVSNPPKRYELLCMRLSLESGRGLLREWRFDNVAYIAGRFLHRENTREMLSEYSEKLEAVGVDIAGPAGFGTGIIHGLTSPFRALRIRGMEFAYPRGVAAWPPDYSFGVILGGLILIILIGFVKSILN
jgi:hypothetical protein